MNSFSRSFCGKWHGKMMIFANYSNVSLLTTSDIVGSDVSVSDISAPRLGADLFFLMMSSKLMSIFSIILELELKLIDEMALDFL